MKRLLFIPFLLVFVLAFCLEEASGSGPKVRILLSESGQPVTVSSTGGLVVGRPGGAFPVTGNTALTILPSGNQLLWKEKNITATGFIIKPAGRDYLFVGQRAYRGHLVLLPGPGIIRTINVLELDDYISGTMKLETNPTWPEDALKAQIIASRTFALRNLERNSDNEYDFCATPLSQAYGGINAEDPRTNRLIDETRNLILTYQDEPANAVFHSQSGGVTEDARHVWGTSVPYLISVPSPWESDAPHSSWKIRISADSLSTTLEHAGLTQGKIQTIQPVYSENGGRVKELVILTDYDTYRISSQRFRQAVGFEVLPSTFFKLEMLSLSETVQREVFRERPLSSEEAFDLASYLERDLTLDDIIDIIERRQRERERKRSDTWRDIPLERTLEWVDIQRPKEFVLVGRGFGHGVGLSQWGSRGMALEGYNYKDILLHYFPGTEIRRAHFR
ncbi:MAG TPA: SpoIID/LytB domain-containing protein [Atribacteraceae bacterium]|nr:SpoIID/LytB domain-containing protein [Atribacteraceae bacterium]